MDHRPPGSSIHGIPPAGTLEWLFPSPGDLPNPGTELTSPVSPALAGGFFTTVLPGKPTECGTFVNEVNMVMIMQAWGRVEGVVSSHEGRDEISK